MLICVCNKASLESCDRCFKYKLLKPDKCMNAPSWRRSLSDIIKEVIR